MFALAELAGVEPVEPVEPAVAVVVGVASKSLDSNAAVVPSYFVLADFAIDKISLPCFSFYLCLLHVESYWFAVLYCYYSYSH